MITHIQHLKYKTNTIYIYCRMLICFKCSVVETKHRPGLILRQNKHVLRASRGKGHHKNPATRQFILSARYWAKNTPKMQVSLFDTPEKATSSFTEASIRYSECCQKLIDAYPDSLNSNLTTELQQFRSYTVFDISLVQQKLQKLDSVMLNKVIVEDNTECAFPNAEIRLRRRKLFRV